MEDELSYLLKLPAEEILKAVLHEALKDLRITTEEESLLNGLKQDLTFKANQLISWIKQVHLLDKNFSFF